VFGGTVRRPYIDLSVTVSVTRLGVLCFAAAVNLESESVIADTASFRPDACLTIATKSASDWRVKAGECKIRSEDLTSIDWIQSSYLVDPRCCSIGLVDFV
jgi:hypothetical protein